MSYDKDKRREIDKRRRQAVRQRIRDTKEKGKCWFCGEDNPLCLEFHHRNPLEKDIAIGTVSKTRSINTLEQELDKCVLLCGNCHRKLHGIMDIPKEQ